VLETVSTTFDSGWMRSSAETDLITRPKGCAPTRYREVVLML